MGCILPRCLLSKPNKIIRNLTACNLSGEAESCIGGNNQLSTSSWKKFFLAFPVPEVGQESCHSNNQCVRAASKKSFTPLYYKDLTLRGTQETRDG